ncbi:MAG: o-succinylbenzoate synthase [Actinomycetia bacterium]|nr:o-succinylbenzoate synthase [Actinomycetes bacterium]MCP4223695.1 o-succinylbenzoate synthase [Actinomycetes bacterium]MCP5030950.1 o-succinylbenzoate synthase [Actinomycetes bacterium]
MLVDRIELRLLNLPLVEPFVAAHGTMTTRELVVVRIETDSGHGWGECSALPEPTYSDEFAGGAFIILEDELGPRIVGHRLTAGDVLNRLAVVGGNPMAKAALEMALLDAELRADGTSLADHLGHGTTEVKAGAAVGLGSRDEVTERIADLVAEGFARVKLKIEPGHDQQVVEQIQAQVPGVEIQLDGNGSYRRDHVSLLTELATSGVTSIEQPFAPGDETTAAVLVEASPVPIVADEAATDLVTVDRLARHGVLSGVSIKPPGLGGIGAAISMHDRALGLGLALTAGGMVESGLGRHSLAAVAGLPGFTLTGDISPAGRWLASDPWPDLSMTDGTVSVPSGPGVAPEPDYESIDHHTIRQAIIKA